MSSRGGFGRGGRSPGGRGSGGRSPGGRGRGRGDGGGRFQRDEGPPAEIVGTFQHVQCAISSLV
jgi:H/ACA ribonucleoprotein complex subunit 1